MIDDIQHPDYQGSALFHTAVSACLSILWT